MTFKKYNFSPEYLYVVLVCAFEEKQICGHTLHESAKQEPFFSFFEDCGLERSGSWTPWSLPQYISPLHVFL